MLSFFLKKAVSLLITFFIIISATFFLMKLIPGDPFHDEKALPKEIHNSLKEHYGLNAPLHEQYIKYLISAIKWDFGPSFKYKDRSVNDIINEGFPVSLLLGLEALFIALTMGVAIGTMGALNYNKWLDTSAIIFMVFCISIPNFAIATLLQYFIAIKLEFLPVARWGTFAHTLLPAISLAILPGAFIGKLIRRQMIDVLQEDYIKTAKAKGLSDKEVLFKHVLRNSLLPVVAYLGQLTANILVGSFVIEKIFAIPGLGQWFVKSVINRDYTAIMGLTIFYSLLLLSSVFIFEMISTLIDPRIKDNFSKMKSKTCGEAYET